MSVSKLINTQSQKIGAYRQFLVELAVKILPIYVKSYEDNYILQKMIQDKISEIDNIKIDIN